MQDYDLKNPGDNQQAQTVRLNVARALSIAHNEANPAKDLAEFLKDAATKAPGYTKPAPDPLPAGQKVVKTGDRVPVQDADADPSNATGTITVTGSNVTVKLTSTTNCILPSAQKIDLKSVIGTGNFGTFTIVNGAITGLVLSDA